MFLFCVLAAHARGPLERHTSDGLAMSAWHTSFSYVFYAYTLIQRTGLIEELRGTFEVPT